MNIASEHSTLPYKVSTVKFTRPSDSSHELIHQRNKNNRLVKLPTTNYEYHTDGQGLDRTLGRDGKMGWTRVRTLGRNGKMDSKSQDLMVVVDRSPKDIARGRQGEERRSQAFGRLSSDNQTSCLPRRL